MCTVYWVRWCKQIPWPCLSKNLWFGPFPFYPVESLDILLLVVTKIVNMSLETAIMPHSLKEAMVRPKLKKNSLDFEVFPHFRSMCNRSTAECHITPAWPLSCVRYCRPWLISRLHTRFGIKGNALRWFVSYLQDRQQFVQVDDARSISKDLHCGLPQGSVLGPILNFLYAAPLRDIIRSHGLSFHLYADDCQVYMSF